jgi:hypothetical protein
MPGTVSISRADIKSREKEWFGGSRDQFSASLQQSRRRSSLERGTLANPTGFGNPRNSSGGYGEPIYRSDEPGVSLHEERRRTFGRGGTDGGYFGTRAGGGADDALQYNQDDADWAGSKYQRGFHSEGPGLSGGGFPPISGSAEPPARSLFADSGNAYSGEGGDRFAPPSYGAAGGAPSYGGTDYGASSDYGAKPSYGGSDYGAKPSTDYGASSNYGASKGYGDYGTTTPAAEEKKSTHLYDHAHIETRPTSRNRKTVIIAGSAPLDKEGDDKRLTIHASDLKSHGNVVKMDEDDLEHMKSKGDIDFVESSIENARAQVTNVEKVTRTLESLHNEMHDFEDRIFFLEHVQLCKMVLQIMMNAQRNMKVAAWRSWNGWSEADGGLAKLKICERLEAEYKECKAKEVEAEALVEQKLKALSDVAMRSLDTRKRNFLVSIFAKGGPEAKNAYFIRWKSIYLMYAKSYRVWKGFFGKLQNMKVNMALQKWKATIYEANMPPEAIIKALQERVARQRMLKEKFEGELEAIVQAETERAFANLDEDKRSLLIRILTRMMKIKQHYAMRVWKDKIKNGAKYEERQKQIINKMMKSYLNIGWQTWRGYMVAANTALGLKGNEQKQRHIKLLFAQLEKLTAYLKKQQVEVEVMRESVQLQAQAARRVLAKRESIISELGDGIAIALEEVTPPPISECELKEPVLRA